MNPYWKKEEESRLYRGWNFIIGGWTIAITSVRTHTQLVFMYFITVRVIKKMELSHDHFPTSSQMTNHQFKTRIKVVSNFIMGWTVAITIVRTYTQLVFMYLSRWVTLQWLALRFRQLQHQHLSTLQSFRRTPSCSR